MQNFSKYHFKDIAENEDIIAVLHRNWFYLLEQLFFIIFSLILFVAGTFLLPIFFPDVFQGKLGIIVPFFESTFFLALWIFGFLIWIDYYFDIWIITSKRIINIEQKGLFMRKVSELTYDKVQDVTTSVNGVIPTIINFGDVKVQTAGNSDEFIFQTVSDPYNVKNMIMEQIQKNKKRISSEFEKIIKENNL